MATRSVAQAKQEPPTPESTLVYNEGFQRFIASVYDMREGAIASLRGADPSQTMATSGRIQAYDDVLAAGEWEKVLLLVAQKRA